MPAASAAIVAEGTSNAAVSACYTAGLVGIPAGVVSPLAVVTSIMAESTSLSACLGNMLARVAGTAADVARGVAEAASTKTAWRCRRSREKVVRVGLAEVFL